MEGMSNKTIASSSVPIVDSSSVLSVDLSYGTSRTTQSTPTPAVLNQALQPSPLAPLIIEEPRTEQTNRNKRKNESLVWKHFKRLRNPDGTLMKPGRSRCIHCPQTYASDPSNGTTTMRHHLLQNCPNSPLRVRNNKQQQLTWDSMESGGNLVAVKYDPAVSRLALAKMVVRDELPFSFVENAGFQEFMRVTRADFHLPSRRTLARDVVKLYEKERDKLRGFLAVSQQRVSLTTDTWTSIQNINYMVLTAHFIDANWKLHKKNLNFCVIPNHKGKTIGKLVEACLIKWGIEKVFTIVVDNASPNQVALNYMKEKLGNWNELILEGLLLHMRCNCHITNLITRDGMEEVHTSIDGIRNAVKYIRSSPSRLEKFRKCAAQEKIESKGGIVPLDVCTRWNSTYFMLDIALKYRKAFSRLEDEDSQFDAYFQEKVGPPKAADWEKAARLVKFLKIFYEATLKFSGTKCVTANEPLLWMCTIVSELDKCTQSDDALMVAVGTEMKKKFDKYWLQLEDMNQVLIIAVVLDPRYKMLYLEFFFPKLQSNPAKVTLMLAEIRRTLTRLFDQYAVNDPVAATASRNVTMPSADTSLMEEQENSHAANLRQFRQLRQEKEVVVIKNELDKYLLEAPKDVSNSNFQTLEWWKENAKRYPILSKIAKDVFAVPASTVASESAFSLGKRVVDPFRAQLTPKMVEGLVCLSDWLRGDKFQPYREPTIDELELYIEMENLELDSNEDVSDVE